MTTAVLTARNTLDDAQPGLQFSFGLFLILALRSLFFCLFAYTLNRFVELGTSPFLVSCGGVIGVILASQLAFTKLNNRGFLAVGAGAYLVYEALFFLLDLVPTGDSGIFWSYNLKLHANLITGAGVLAAVTTWAFWRFRHALTIEILTLGGAIIYLFSGSRNYRFDMLRLLSTYAWDFGVSPLAMMVIFGVFSAIILGAYLYVATIPSKPTVSSDTRPISHHGGQPRYVLGTLFLIGCMAALYLIALETYRYHGARAGTMMMDGVGDETGEGLSPLDFHSALGASNHPSAVVRLEGDYSENPYSPMLYLREGALSDLVGNKLVGGPRSLDRDAPQTPPTEHYQGKQDEELQGRVPVTQSVFLLTKHNLAFGIDYPISIVRLKNPANTSRFKSSYRVYSMAPAFDMKELPWYQVGDPRWSEETQAYYLKQHADPRYKQVAEEISADAVSPLEKAKALTDYLNKTAIYTLAPKHDVPDGDDPVAPFLFGDHRGYCVHFAHATVYMLRGLGIPSRIGTGYLTDLSQSKDGHILLRMSDRHAWAEVYVTGVGWVPFDTMPEQVESHAESPVDQSLLDELMGLLEPGEEILPDGLLADESLPDPVEDKYYAPDPSFVLLGVLAAVMAVFIFKFYVMFSWLLPAAPSTRLRRGYISVLASLYDIGVRRRFGETREEFHTRAKSEVGIPVLGLTDALNEMNYSPSAAENVSKLDVTAVVRGERRALEQLSFGKRFLSWLNPASVFSALGGRRW